ncbi:DUF6326 family protein [Euzebya tangerina]|uniref:DUF6326 family protein n=1 Tax=Euzebya tangerina TaxID=591198 RepID=UPI000E31F03F|nr:DUF6326 family protein [Euzebya tangerina]
MTDTITADRPLDPRLQIAGLWTAVLLVFAFVDLFSLYRPDVRAELAEGTLAGFEIGEPFLLSATLYVAIPSVMVALTLLLPRRMNRGLNIALGVIYVATIIGAAIGEMAYYLVGSVIEVVLLAVLIVIAWRWPRPA